MEGEEDNQEKDMKIRIELVNASKSFLKEGKHKGALERFTKLFTRVKDKEEEFWILDDISLIVRGGENLGVIGKNGSAKSTLLRAIAEIYILDRGTIKTQGEMVYLTGFGYGLESKLTMRENIFLSGSVMGLSQEAIRKRFDEIVEFSGLKEYLDEKLFKFSSGMQTRLASAIGLHCVSHRNPDILLVDEVVGGGADKEYQKKSLKKMEELLKGGASVILVSHNLEAIEKYCDKAIWLDNGKIVMYGSPSEVVKKYKMSGQ